MKRRGRRLGLVPRRGGPRDAAAGDGVDRRTVLVGAAATAGAVVVAASPQTSSAMPAVVPHASAAPAAVAGGAGLVAASDVSVLPAGEIIDTDAQAVFEALDRRLSKASLIDDLQVAVTLVDDFMGGAAATAKVGELGWSLGFGATGTAVSNVVASQPGLITLGTGTSSTGWQMISLGNANLRGSRVFMCEWRLRVNNPTMGANAFSCWVGLHNNVGGGEPTTGIYFQYTPSGVNWQAVCAENGSRTVADTGVPANGDFHRFRFTGDGAGTARFYIDSVVVATITSTLPTTLWHAPCASIAKSTGTAVRAIAVDYFALRWEQAR
jgi:hypothetical protein